MSAKKSEPQPDQEVKLKSQLALVLRTFHINLTLLPMADRERLLSALCDTFFHSEEAMEWAEIHCREMGWEAPR